MSKGLRSGGVEAEGLEIYIDSRRNGLQTIGDDGGDDGGDAGGGYGGDGGGDGDGDGDDVSDCIGASATTCL